MYNLKKEDIQKRCEILNSIGLSIDIATYIDKMSISIVNTDSIFVKILKFEMLFINMMVEINEIKQQLDKVDDVKSESLAYLIALVNINTGFASVNSIIEIIIERGNTKEIQYICSIVLEEIRCDLERARYCFYDYKDLANKTIHISVKK